MKIIFVGQFVSKDESILDKRISQAGNNYQLKFVDMLSPNLSISICPIFIRLKTNSIASKKNVVIVNSRSGLPPVINKIYRFFFDTIKVLSIIKGSKLDHVFFYNIDKQNILSLYFTRLLLGKKVYLILADYPYFKNKSLLDKLANKIIQSIDGVITLNSNLKVNANQQILPGLLRANQIYRNSKPLINNNVLFSGSLGRTTGLELALETFSQRTDYNLFITGRPYDYIDSEFDQLIEYFTCRFDNIKYLGLLNYEEYLEILDKCDITLSLRNPLDKEHQFNFPSKILEYLSNSKLVISSMIYPDLPAPFLFITDFDSKSLGNTLDKIKIIDGDSVIRLKGSIYNYLNSQFTESTLINICNTLIKND